MNFAHKIFLAIMGIVDDRTAEFLAEIRRAMEASREEAGLPTSTTAAHNSRGSERSGFSNKAPLFKKNIKQCNYI